METADPPSPLVTTVTATQANDFTTLFDFLPIGAYRSSPDGRQIRANPAQVQLNGYTHEAELVAAMQDIGRQWYVDPSRRTAFREMLERQGHVRGFVSEVYRHKTGERIWVSENAHVVRDAAGHILFYEGTVEDITERVRADAELHRRDEIWKLALESTGDGVWDWNLAEGVARMSRRCLEMYGLGAHDLRPSPHSMDQRTHPDDKDRMLRDRQSHLDGDAPSYVNEHRVLCADGSWKWVLARGMVISRDAQGKPLRMVGTHTDITQRKEAEALIWHQANFDALTALPNRRMLRDRLSQHMLRCDRERLQLALLFIDLDHFKAVNDTLGHEGGDRLLVEAAQRLSRCVRASDTVARMGGDEFTVVLPELHEVREVERIVQAILRELARAFHLGDEPAFVSASIGITFYPGDGQSVDDLLRQADQALYVAKDAGRNRFAYFTPALQEGAQLRARVANDLHGALPAQQLSVEYQPIVALASGAVYMAEALLRWHHPRRGRMAPMDFVPIAEANGMIVEIGEWVFREAARQTQLWRSQLDPRFQISVNKSPVQFHRADADHAQWLRELAALGLPRHAMTVEITESLLLDPSANVADHLMALRAAGIGVSLDDFGTGYSSLAYLQRYDIDFIKIDKSFVAGLAPQSNDLALCKAMVVMAHQLGIAVIAEGVETLAQRDLLVDAGCDYAQGYLFAPAMPPGQFETWFSQPRA
ncbi:putative bifunctional diguanylate cyclase/phosphodiesterase [Pseudorhodoferax soli]|uniref:PAS domain S-box-containing protein/diguanylate cyclase (GGDEF)-like protein n=1 Tax=Pseudorhodoferax soli TaxID=545864 RepID=A0A368Y128_9BURK|nr:GGDEF and EAL domain-containing protein [Pseudorhodoferax soli]RCW74040.1 PAS domain S-box-containing protein/diguanylate cyclase (GGDEF)-like protein [Pseudorhodoferax soli]